MSVSQLRARSVPKFLAVILLLSGRLQAFAPDKMDTILLGVAYYPEYAPSERFERVVRQIGSRLRNHPAVIGYQIDNETLPSNAVTPYTTAAFLDRLKRKYETPATVNRIWGLVYWGQLIDTWDDLPPRNGILNPGYKLEWENFHHDIA